MPHVVIFLFAAWGVGVLISTLAQRWPAERLSPVLCKLVRCELCLGFWAGLAFALFGFGVWHPVIDAPAAAGFSWLMRVVTAKLGADDL